MSRRLTSTFPALESTGKCVLRELRAPSAPPRRSSSPDTAAIRSARKTSSSDERRTAPTRVRIWGTTAPASRAAASSAALITHRVGHPECLRDALRQRDTWAFAQFRLWIARDDHLEVL